MKKKTKSVVVNEVVVEKADLDRTMKLADRIPLGTYLRWLIVEGLAAEKNGDAAREDEVGVRFMRIVEEVAGEHGTRLADYVMQTMDDEGLDSTAGLYADDGKN